MYVSGGYMQRACHNRSVTSIIYLPIFQSQKINILIVITLLRIIQKPGLVRQILGETLV